MLEHVARKDGSANNGGTSQHGDRQKHYGRSFHPALLEMSITPEVSRRLTAVQRESSEKSHTFGIVRYRQRNGLRFRFDPLSRARPRNAMDEPIGIDFQEISGLLFDSETGACIRGSKAR
jgi:hypothetical protein